MLLDVLNERFQVSQDKVHLTRTSAGTQPIFTKKSSSLAVYAAPSQSNNHMTPAWHAANAAISPAGTMKLEPNGPVMSTGLILVVDRPGDATASGYGVAVDGDGLGGG